MSSSFLGKIYTLVKSENFDEYMKALGVGLTLRKMGNTISSQCLLTKNEDNVYTFWLKTPYRCCKTSFKLNEPFTEVTLDNRVVETTCSLDGNIFVQEQRAKGLKITKIVREYQKNGEELITTLFVGDIKAVRYYVNTKDTSDDIFQKQPSDADESVPRPSVQCILTVGNKTETTEVTKKQPNDKVEEPLNEVEENVVPVQNIEPVKHTKKTTEKKSHVKHEKSKKPKKDTAAWDILHHK